MDNKDNFINIMSSLSSNQENARFDDSDKIIDETGFIDTMNSLSLSNKNKKFDDEYITNDKRSMNEHNECYTRILETYSYTLEANILEKNELKKEFFYVCSGILKWIAISFIVTLIICLFNIFKYPKESFDIASIVSVMGAMATAFISSFMILPKVITRYLFNKKEEENMMNVINKIQKYDTRIRQNIKDHDDKKNNRK
ncbi:hypothetical protein [Megamonas funiformis]|uniref:hypothetical protein n=2 Tax=Megamonas funiformis TaxID=437897 RepID=UPI003562F755